MKKLLLILVLLVSVPVFATDWRETGLAGGDLKQIYLNYDSFTPTETGTYEAWSKWLIKLKNPKSLTETNYILAKDEFDCDKIQYKNLRSTSFNQKGEVLRTFDYPDYVFNEPLPDSRMEGLISHVCSLTGSVKNSEKCKDIKELYEAGLLSKKCS
jgi:hypothetical protein